MTSAYVGNPPMGSPADDGGQPPDDAAGAAAIAAMEHAALDAAAKAAKPDHEAEAAAEEADRAAAAAVLHRVGEVVAYTQEWLGAPLTTYVAGADAPAQLDEWLAEPASPHAADAELRLRTAAAVIDTFNEAGEPAAAKAWLREPSAETVQRSPASLLRHTRNERLLGQIRAAAHRRTAEDA